MNVYVACRGYDYEGFEIIGIFKTREEAKGCCDEDKDEWGSLGDSHDIQVHEVK